MSDPEGPIGRRPFFCPRGHRIVDSTGEHVGLKSLGNGRYLPVSGTCEQVDSDEPEGGALVGVLFTLAVEGAAVALYYGSWAIRSFLGQLLPWRW